MILSENENKPSWKDFWADSMVTKFHHLVTDSDTSKKVILNLLDSIEVGNSCIQVAASDVNALGGLASVSNLRKAPFYFDGDLLYMDQHFQLEASLAYNVRRIVNAPSIELDSAEFEHLLTDEHQKKSLQVAFKNNLTLITGGPGTGKTYTLARIIAGLNKVCNNPRIAMAAPTGKAAQRMQEALQSAFSNESLIKDGLVTENLKGLVPVTLHRLLGIGFSGKSTYSKDKKLPFDILVIDEVSMLDLNIASQFFNAVADGTRVILLGDPKQLASVDVGGVLLDLKTSALLENNQVQLVRSVRFGDDTAIGRMAKFILNKSDQDTDQDTDQAAVHDFIKLIDGQSAEIDLIHASGNDDCVLKLRNGYDQYARQVKNYSLGVCGHDELVASFDKYRILTATKHGEFGLHHLNSIVSNYLSHSTNQDGEWYLGRPVMITQNNYKLGLSNGDIGVCVHHRENKGEFEVYFQSSNKWISTTRLPKTIETAYVMTIHKSQGSEFSRVAVVLDDSDSASRILSMELIYTAITRAKHEIHLVCGQKALSKSLSVKTTRKSGLHKKLN